MNPIQDKAIAKYKVWEQAKKDFKWTLSKVEGTFLGIEDHGLFTFFVYTSSGGNHQGFGGYVLGGEKDGKLIRRILEVIGVDEWEQLKGRPLYTLRGEDGHSRIAGIASAYELTGSQEILIMDEFYKEELAK